MSTATHNTMSTGTQTRTYRCLMCRRELPAVDDLEPCPSCGSVYFELEPGGYRVDAPYEGGVRVRQRSFRRRQAA